jgi:hypothetical protein
MVNIFLYLLIFLSEVDELIEEENVILERQMSGGSSEGVSASTWFLAMSHACINSRNFFCTSLHRKAFWVINI